MKTQNTTSKQEQFKNKLIEHINNNPNGFTIDFNLKPLNKNKGYVIALTNNNSKDINALIDNLFILKENFKQYSKNLFIGGWLDNETKTYFLDLSIYVTSKKYGLLIAKLYNQKAIFDFKNLNCINIDYGVY